MAAASVITALAVKEKTPTPPIDRKEICPFLLRVFTNTGRPYHISEFARGNLPHNQVSIYTWMDATLKELASLIKQMNPEARRKGTFIDFYVVFPQPLQGKYVQRDIGSVCVGRKGTDDMATLKEKRFVIGDYLSVAISTPMTPTRVAPRMRPY
ncbi:histone deacetylase complex subunit SAP18-like [Watersipora subatra]|uniref:histone deacetylase complex subunit SAP18-like n=1 Tax=Watersipora subatra TaxID=2589382 RepID=UPI00355B67D3